MVIGEKFAWGHLRKTGGNATLMMFQLVPELIHTADPNHLEGKHRPFVERDVHIENKLLVCNIRRLPSIVLSWFHHMNHWGHKGKPVAMRSPHEMSESSLADSWLAHMTSDGRFEIAWWLRWEDLARDFIELVSQYTEVDEETRDRIFKLGQINALHYDHEVSHWFSEEQIARLYENNPIWAAAEQDAYEGRRSIDSVASATPVDAAAS